MAARTVTVNLRLDAGSYLAIARSVVNANNAIDRSLNDIGASAAAAGSAMNHMGRDMAAAGRRARLAERRMRELREEIARLQAQAAAGIPPFLNGPGGGGGGGGMRGMLMSPEVLGAGGILLGAVGPAIGAALSGVILAAVGSAGLAAGIAASIANDAEVRGAFVEFGRFVKSEFKSYGEAFDVPLIDAADHFHDRFASLSPKIRGVLAEMAVGVKPLSEGLFGFLEKAGPGVAEALRGSLPVLRALAAELPAAGEALGTMFELIANGSEGAADGIVALVKVLEYTGIAVGAQLNYLSTIFGAMGNIPEPIKSFLFGGSAGLLGGGDVKSMTPIAGTLDDLRYKADETASAFDRVTQSTLAMTAGFNDQWGAAIAWEQGLDDLTESVKQNGTSLDITTQKGRDNASALKAMFENAERTYEANIKSGMSAQEAARKYNEQIEQARAAAKAAGFAADEVNRLADAQRKLPTGERQMTYKVVTRYVTEGTRPNWSPGVVRYERDGGIVYARDGLMAFGGASGIASGGRPLIGFAEPGTGGEAFIARNAPQSRSLAIANVAAGWHGGQVVPKGWPAMTRTQPTVVRFEAAPGQAGNWLVEGFLSALHSGQLRVRAGDAGRIEPA